MVSFSFLHSQKNVRKHDLDFSNYLREQIYLPLFKKGILFLHNTTGYQLTISIRKFEKTGGMI